MLRDSLVIAVVSLGFLADPPDPANPDPDTPRPIPALDTVFIEGNDLDGGSGCDGCRKEHRHRVDRWD